MCKYLKTHKIFYIIKKVENENSELIKLTDQRTINGGNHEK